MGGGIAGIQVFLGRQQLRCRPGIFRIWIPDGKEEKVEDLRDVPLAGVFIISMSLDPTEAAVIARRTGTDDIYALTLER